MRIAILKNENLYQKSVGNFNSFAQNIDCGHRLEPPRRVPTLYVLEQNKRKKWYKSCKPQYFYIKVGSKRYTFQGHVFLMRPSRSATDGYLHLADN